MPRYQVMINGETYEVASDRDLSDVEVYRYAKQRGFQKAESIGPPVGAVDRLLNALPMLGGAAGGLIGGVGGAVGGMGFGGVPGALGGATLGGATGEAMRQTGRRILGGSRELPATPTAAATDIGLAGAEQGALQAAGEALGPALGTIGTATYRGYLKPSLAKSALPKVRQIVETAIQEWLPVTEAGSAHAKSVIKDLRGQVEQALSGAQGEVDLHQVAERVRQFAKTKYYRPGTPSADYEAALGVADSIDKHPSLNLPPGAMPTRVMVHPTQANAVKRGLDTSIRETQFGVKSGAATSAEKFARHDLRQELERLSPEIGPLNARESKLIDAAKAIDRAVGREGNRSALFGVPTLMAGIAGGEEYKRTGNPYMAAAEALAARAFLTPAVASRAALVAAHLGKMTGAIPATVARAAILAVSEAQDQAQRVPSQTSQQP